MDIAPARGLFGAIVRLPVPYARHGAACREDGSLILNCQLPAEAGMLVLKALDLAVGELPDTGDSTADVPARDSLSVATGTSPERISLRTRRADALTLMAESFLAHGAMQSNGADRPQIVVHVAAETLRDRTAGCCEFDDGPSIAAETARRLACDASVVALIEDDDGEPLNVGRKTRTISAALRRALEARDKGCRFLGCCNSRHVDAHHIVHWANGGETRPTNLICLCRFHHHAIHEGGFRIEVLDDGALRFVKPNGTAVDSIAPGYTQPLGDWKRLPADNERHRIRIEPRTAVTRWAGETMDYGLGIEVLLQKERRGRDVPAGTSGGG